MQDFDSENLNLAANGLPENLPIPQNNFPPPKTDKPRPHGCTTCGRSFARLEHLKRHERSHTKEKPFECPECTRCFARRDLLLRHQQKLHMTTTPAARPRAGRRESASSNLTAGSKVRKGSASTAADTASMRPRANTISHTDGKATGFIAAINTNTSAASRKRPGHSTHPSLCGLPTISNFEYRGMSAMPRNRPHPGLSKIETQGLPMDLSGNLRTAPPLQGFSHGFVHDQMFSPGNTINPAQLHFLDSPTPLPFDTPISPFHPTFNFMSSPGLEDDGTFDWINGFDSSMTFGGEGNENAIAESSPSAMSSGSPVPLDIVPEMFHIQNNSQPSGAWQPSTLSQTPMLADYSMGMPFHHIGDLKDPSLGFEDNQFYPQHQLNIQSSHFHSDLHSTNGLHMSFMSNADTPTTTTASVGSSNRHSSVTSVCTDAITDTTRSALLAALSHPGAAHHRKFSSPSSATPKVGEGHSRTRSIGTISLPSTYDLQRYIGAYIQFFHPHLPFLHVPTLSFNSPSYTNNLRSSDGLPSYASGIAGGGGCLILAMAAIGALYASDNAASKELFDLAKKMIQAYLEERRKADISPAMNGRHDAGDDNAQNTPLWLVQAMLLNVIYGHNCGDKVSADIASTHCAALVSLARAADLAKPVRDDSQSSMLDSIESGGWSMGVGGGSSEASWYNWKVGEEKKRTLYAVYILSSILVSAYNHSPALTNSEILLDLPCEEDVWAADSYEAWLSLGGLQGISARSITFADSLGWLLGASQRQPHNQHNTMRLHHPLHLGGSGLDMPTEQLPISTFGCLVLIHSLHNYIWETRQRHIGRQWTSAETEAMHGHIEPALVAWQAAWASHPHHSLERPNPYGMGPLSADSIPLLDLAYVRLFVNLGRSKEAFWHRDWEQMAYEIARGAEIVQHADSGAQTPGFSMPGGDHFGGSQSYHSSSPESQNGQSTKRERHMRKAAFHAAHSLCTSDKLGVSFAYFNSRELPIVSAMCAFDCAQVLAEWVTTVQERVGQYMGILGKDPIDFEAVPAIMLLDQEDVKLFQKIDEFLASMELRQAMDNADPNNMGSTKTNRVKPLISAYGSKILMVTLYMLERSAVWPGKHSFLL